MKKKKKPKEKKKSRFERIITEAVVVLSLLVAVSLFIYFRPFTLRDGVYWIQGLGREAQKVLAGLARPEEASASSPEAQYAQEGDSPSHTAASAGLEEPSRPAFPLDSKDASEAASSPEGESPSQSDASLESGSPSQSDASLESGSSSQSDSSHETQSPSQEVQESPVSSQPQGIDESIPFLTPSTDLGEISDLNTDFSDYSYEEESIYMAMLDTVMGPMLYYNQGDSRWSSYLYGGLDSMGGYGCGPTAVAMLVNSFTSSTVTPVEIADWSAANGYFAHGSGSYHSLIPDCLRAYGLSVESVTDRTPENVRKLLAEGRLLVALMGRGSLARVGHFIIITSSCENGNVHIADPNSLSNSTLEWDLQQLMDELKGSYDSGGPLWSVGIAPQSGE